MVNEKLQPENSYDVSLLIACLKPHWDLGGISKEELLTKVGHRRSQALLAWAKENANHGWLCDHR